MRDLPDHDQVLALVLNTISDLNADWHIPELTTPSADTPLWGSPGSIDSMALVMLIAEIEARVGETFGLGIILADERAMSRGRSPFRRVDLLAQFVRQLIEAAATQAVARSD